MDSGGGWGFPKVFHDGGVFGGGPLPYVMAPLVILVLGLLVRWAWTKASGRRSDTK